MNLKILHTLINFEKLKLSNDQAESTQYWAKYDDSKKVIYFIKSTQNISILDDAIKHLNNADNNAFEIGTTGSAKVSNNKEYVTVYTEETGCLQDYIDRADPNLAQFQTISIKGLNIQQGSRRYKKFHCFQNYDCRDSSSADCRRAITQYIHENLYFFKLIFRK